MYKLIILLLFSQNLLSQKQFVINAHVSHSKDGDKIYYSYYKNSSNAVVDSAIIKNGKFTVKGNIEYPTLFNIFKKLNEYIEKNNYHFFFGFGRIDLKLDFSDFSQSTTNKNKYQEDFLLYTEYKKSVVQKLVENRELRKKYEEGNSEINKNIIEKFDSIESSTELEYIMKDVDFAKENPSSFVALHYLFFNLGRSIGRKHFKEIKSGYDAMDFNIKNSPLGIFIKEKLFLLENSNVGGIATDFTNLDFFGNTFSLSDFFGKKVILLDFWASWCEPCKKQHPFLQKIHNQYKDSGLEIIGISKDTKVDAWKKSVEKENMEWINTIATEESQTMLNAYVAQAIPLIILIDKNQKIVGRWTGYDVRYNDEIEKMISEILNN